MTANETHIRTLITKNYLHSVIVCMEKEGYSLSDFEITTEKVRGYHKGHLSPKAIIYVFRISTGIEKNYVLEGETSFSVALCKDLKSRLFDNLYIE